MKNTMVLSRGTTSIEINTPEYGYTSNVALALSVGDPSSGKIELFDNQSEFDILFCEMAFNLPSAQQKTLQDFIRGVGRGPDIQMLVHRGIDPFGPDLTGEDRRFIVRVVDFDFGGVRKTPYEYLSAKIKFLMKSAPEFTIPSAIPQGSAISIGGINGFPYPHQRVTPDTVYGISITPIYGGDTDFENNTVNYYQANITLRLNRSMAARLVNYLKTTGRANSIPITCGRGVFLFGADNCGEDGSGVYRVKLIDNVIEIVHRSLDVYLVSIKICFKKWYSTDSSSSVSFSSYSDNSNSLSTSLSNSSSSDSSHSSASASLSSSSLSVSSSSDSSSSDSSSSVSASKSSSLSFWSSSQASISQSSFSNSSSSGSMVST